MKTQPTLPTVALLAIHYNLQKGRFSYLLLVQIRVERRKILYTFFTTVTPRYSYNQVLHKIVKLFSNVPGFSQEFCGHVNICIAACCVITVFTNYTFSCLLVIINLILEVYRINYMTRLRSTCRLPLLPVYHPHTLCSSYYHHSIVLSTLAHAQFKPTASCKFWRRVYVANLGAMVLFRGSLWESSLILRCTGDQVIELQIFSKDMSATVTHPCGILPLAQARPKMPCIYTSCQAH